MLQRVSDRLTDLLLEKGIIKNDDREIYIYGLLAMFSTVINFFLVLAIGVIAGLFIETLMYLLGFALLRSYCGGYHAKTQLGCAIGFTFIYGLSMLVLRALPADYSRYFSIISGGICLIFIFIFAPIEHKNRIFIGNEYKKFRLISRLVALVYFIVICIIAMFFDRYMFAALIISLVMLSVSFVLAIALVLYERSESK